MFVQFSWLCREDSCVGGLEARAISFLTFALNISDNVIKNTCSAETVVSLREAEPRRII
jgi:hypothetical protein